ncbi:NAD(P)-dependent oxidoreductase [Chloroflexota bacterium]
MKHKHIGFIGLGEMGWYMSRCLIDKGFNVTVYDIRMEPALQIEKLGGHIASSPKELAKVSNTIISMVSDDTQTEEVICGKNGVIAGTSPGTTIIISSTVSPSLCRNIAKYADNNGVGLLDAPVSGGTIAAQSGSLTFMVGGDRKLFDECRSLFDAMGNNVFYMGVVGAGEVAKLVNNLVLFLNILSANEGLKIGEEAGIEQDALLKALMTSSGNSWVLEHWDFLTIARRQGEKNMQMVRKDLKLAIDLAEELGINVPIAKLGLNLDYSLPKDRTK